MTAPGERASTEKPPGGVYLGSLADLVERIDPFLASIGPPTYGMRTDAVNIRFDRSAGARTAPSTEPERRPGQAAVRWRRAIRSSMDGWVDQRDTRRPELILAMA